jgi:hypothetical protein
MTDKNEPSDLIGRLALLHRNTTNLKDRATIKEALRLLDPTDDMELTALQMQDKYSPNDGGWGGHPDYEFDEWRQEVADENTLLGYWDWVYNAVQRGDQPT